MLFWRPYKACCQLTEGQQVRQLTGGLASDRLWRMNRGSQALAPLVEKHGEKSALAKRLVGKTDEAQVGRWAAGKRKPDTRNRLQLEQLLGIPIAAWDEPADEAEDPDNSDAA